jgi:hypothetical protein
VQREFNGLGQLTTEYQSHAGAVNTAGTPKVQYAYSEMAGGANHSRLTSLTYPAGKVISYVYDAGLDSAVSRVSELAGGVNTLLLPDLYRGTASFIVFGVMMVLRSALRSILPYISILPHMQTGGASPTHRALRRARRGAMAPDHVGNECCHRSRRRTGRLECRRSTVAAVVFWFYFLSMWFA